MEALLANFMNQHWFQIAGEVVLMVSGITAAIPNAWAQKIPFFGKINMVLDWASLNVFNNKNVGAK